MRAVLFEGTPEEFATVEAVFQAGGDAALQTGSIGLPRARPKAWPELGEEQCYRLAKRVLEIMAERVRDALSYLAEVQAFHGEQTVDGWAEHAGHLPDALCGYLAELGRCASRAFIELFGCDNAPERVKGAADMLVQKVTSREGAYFVVRPGLMRATAELDLLNPLPSAPEQSTDAETAGASEPRPAAGVPRRSPAPPSAGTRRPPSRTRAVAMPKPPSPPEAARPSTPRPHAPPGGILGEMARLLAPLADNARPGSPGTPATESSSQAPAARPGRNPFSLLDWADPER